MFRYHTLDDYSFEGKTVGVRVDINSPIINKKVVLNERIIAHAKTIEELSNKGAKVIILAHQGRKGRDDCVSLEVHAKLLTKQIDKEVQFINEVYSKQVEKKDRAIKRWRYIIIRKFKI